MTKKVHPCKLEVFAKDHLNVAKEMELALIGYKTLKEKHFPLVPQCFQNVSSSR